MKRVMFLFVVFVILTAHLSYGQEPANYEITIDGKKRDISLGREYQMKLRSGETVTVRVNRKAIVTYKDDFISFQHKSDLTVSSTDIGNGIRQTMTNTALGTLILFQEYSTMDPSTLIDMMLQELTKEQVQYGYALKKESFSRKLGDGTEFKGKMATLSYKDEVEYWSVLSFGKRGKGLLVITKIDKDNMKQEKDVIDLMWNSLSLGF